MAWLKLQRRLRAGSPPVASWRVEIPVGDLAMWAIWFTSSP